MTKTVDVITPAIADDTTQSILARILLTGDLAVLTDEEKWKYVVAICQRLKLDPLMQPFKILHNKKLGTQVLYATKACGEQLIRINELDVTPDDVVIDRELAVAKCISYCVTPSGRRTKATGYVSLDYYIAPGKLAMLRGDDLCNALMKCETKAVQRSVLRCVSLGMPSECELETIRYSESHDLSYVDQELIARGNLLSQDQRKEVIAWWRNNADSIEPGDTSAENAAAHNCLADLKYHVETRGGKDEAYRLREQMIREVIEVSGLDAQETQRRRTAPKRGAKIEPEESIIEESIIMINTTTPENALEAPVIAVEVLTEVDSIARLTELKQGDQLLSDLRSTVPPLAELSGKKKPINEEVAKVLNAVLLTIRQEREAGTALGGTPVRPSPSWESERELVKKVTSAAKWPQEKIQYALKYQHRLHAESMKNPEFFTWDKLVDMCAWFASKNHDSYKTNEDKK